MDVRANPAVIPSRDGNEGTHDARGVKHNKRA